ncbi:MAG: CAP domain-containing protein [Myxococcaceae bacterium]
MNFAVPLIALMLAATPAELEATASRHVAKGFERVGRRTPVRDPALDKAARAVAFQALEVGARKATELTALTEAVSSAGAWDPSPRALVLKGSPAEAPIAKLGEREDLGSEPASHVGVGVAVRGKASAVVVLLTDRQVRLEPFARQLPKPGVRELCGVLEPPLEAPEAWVTLPSGAVERPKPAKAGRGRFCYRVQFAHQGRHTLEVLGRGPKGPEVVALWFTDMGEHTAPREGDPDEEPSDPEVARERILERINALRRAHGVAPLTLEPRVTEVAQAYSERMSSEGFFAHVAPDGSTVGQRLQAREYSYRAAGENLGLASGPLSAHFGIEHSPGHRRNLIDPQYTRIGIGIAARTDRADPQVIVTEVLVDPARTSGDPLGEAYAALADRRKSLGLPRLERHEVLEQLALDHARKALALDEPKSQLPDSKLHERVFAAVDEVGAASIDVVIADSPALITQSKSLQDPKNRLVGVGAVKGDSSRFGQDKFWVVVIYASQR